VPLDTGAMRAHAYFLSHDQLRGRATGTRDADVAALYVASQCRRLGLSPAANGYLQPVPLEESAVGSDTQLEFSRSDQRLTFRYPEDFTPDVGNRETLANFSGPAFYVGRPADLTASALGDVSLSGAVAVVLGARLSTEAADLLRRKGATGVLHILADQATYDLYRRSRGSTRLYHADPAVRSSFIPSVPSVIAGPRVSAALVASTLLGTGEPQGPVPLELDVSLSIALERRQFDAYNVTCFIAGADPSARDTAITFTAHYDHLGVGVPDAAGDSVYNGFSDNAAGVAMLLAIAQFIAGDSAPPPRHTMQFLFLVGEERGLLGSDYYVARPAWPLERTAAVINLDAGAPPAAPTSWELAGVDSSGLGATAIRLAEDRGWTVKTSRARANSDYYPFVRAGVQGLFIIPGQRPYEGLSVEQSQELKRRWDYYHQPGDEWHEDFPFAGLLRYAAYGYLVARALDGATDAPH
jgi:hypothetical protein